MLDELGRYADIYREIDEASEAANRGFSGYALKVMGRRHILRLSSLVPVFMILVYRLRKFLSVFCHRRGSTPRRIRCFLGREGGLGRKWADQTGFPPWRAVKVAFSPDSGDARPAGSAEPGSAGAAEAARCRFRPVSTSTCDARSPRDCA